MLKGKMVVRVGLKNSWKKKKKRERSERQRRKGKIYPSECRVPEKTARRDKKSILSEKRKEIEENNRA